MRKESKPVLFYFLLFSVPSTIAYFFFIVMQNKLGAAISLLIVALSYVLVLLATTHFKERAGIVANILNRKFLVFPILFWFAIVILVFREIDTLTEGIFLYLSYPIIFNLFYNTVFCFIYIFFKEEKYHDFAEGNEKSLQEVTVLIATRNEPFDVAKMTFDSAWKMQYPAGKKQLMVVDNSDIEFEDYLEWRDYVESFNGKKNTKVSFVHRDGTEGFKPKNLDIAMEHIETEFVMLLDVDSTLEPKALLKAMPEFIDRPELGFIQLQTSSTNNICGPFAGVLAILQTTQRFVLNLRGHGGFVLFYGHNGIWRMSAANKAGNWLEYTRGEPMITEDMALTIKGYLSGYYGKTLWVNSGEWVPGALKELESMWLRWTYGNSQVLWKYMFNIFFSRRLTFFEKVDMFQTAIIYISCGLTPIFAVLGLLHPNTSFFGFCYMMITLLPPTFLMLGYMRKNSDPEVSFFKKMWRMYSAFFIVNTYITWIMARGMFNFIVRKKQGWKPTGKSSSGESASWWSVMMNNLAVIIFSSGGIIVFFIVIVGRAMHHWYNENLTELLFMAPGVLFVFNLLLSIILYGGAVMPRVFDLDKMQITSRKYPFGC